MSVLYILRDDERELAAHSTRLAARLDAMRRGIAKVDRWGFHFLRSGPWIEPRRAAA